MDKTKGEEIDMVIVVAAYVIVISIVLFAMMGVDKYKAQHNMWRIPEKVLLTLGVIGGGIGGFVGGQVFHHKTRKWYFQAAWAIGAIVAVASVGLLFVFQ
jgi:uncharacterized membrane protein YsdA (DUF1294 family)